MATKKKTQKRARKPAVRARRPAPKARARTLARPSRKAKARVAPGRKKIAPRQTASRRAGSKLARKTASARRPLLVKAPQKAAGRRPTAAPKPPVLQRQRRVLAESERLGKPTLPDHMMAAARSGHDEIKASLRRHNESSPELTAGDVDAKWEDAYAVGDEAPGGDNPTPGQDRVDDIGKALGIEYDDDEELLGGEEVTERDHHRWELDPDSKEKDEDED